MCKVRPYTIPTVRTCAFVQLMSSKESHTFQLQREGRVPLQHDLPNNDYYTKIFFRWIKLQKRNVPSQIKIENLQLFSMNPLVEMNQYSKTPYSSTFNRQTLGHLLDMAVDNLMNDPKFRNSMETKKSIHSWSSGFQVRGDLNWKNP